MIRDTCSANSCEKIVSPVQGVVDHGREEAPPSERFTACVLGTALVMVSFSPVAGAVSIVTVPPGLEFWFALSVAV